MATVARENIGVLNDKIVVKVSKEDYLPTFEKKVKEYSKTANIPGFRKGMVPPGMIKKMYGPSIYTDEILKTVEKQLYGYLETEKPEIFAQPLALDADVRSFDFNHPSDYEFGFEIGLKPVFEIAPLDKANLANNKVVVTEQMVEEDVERYQEKGGELKEVEAINSDKAVVNILFTEVGEEGSVIEGGIEKEKSVVINTLTHDTQQQLIGKKKGDTIVVQLERIFDKNDLALFAEELGFVKGDEDATRKYFKLTILKIEEAGKREMSETFFGEIFPGAGIVTEEEFRNKIKEQLEQYFSSQSLNQLNDQIYHYLLAETKMDFPESFLKRWLQLGGEERRTPEQAEAEFPGFTNQLKWTLIRDKIIKDNNLDVTPDELKAFVKEGIVAYFGSMGMKDEAEWLDSYVERIMKDEKQVEASYRRLINEKLFTWIRSKTQPAENLVSPEDLAAMQHHHDH